MELSIDDMHLLVLNVGLARHESDWNWTNVCSPFTRLYYVTEGVAQVKIGERVYDLTPNHLYMIPAYTTHSDICEGHFVHYYVHIYEDLHNSSSILEDIEFPIIAEALPEDLHYFELLVKVNPMMCLPQSNPCVYDNSSTLLHNIFMNKQRTLAEKLESRGILYILISRFLNDAKLKVKKYDDRINVAFRYIRNHLFDTINIGDVARDACMSKDHFIRLFKKEVGDTPMHYINERKIEKAELMLLAGNTPIKNIAYDLAFKDDSYFNRVFRRYTGMTPVEYRCRHKQ